MTKEGWVICILSLQLTISGIVISHLCYKLGYEQGRASVTAYGQNDEGEIGTCYVPGGCANDTHTSTSKRHK